jgi:hypothetical protein
MAEDNPKPEPVPAVIQVASNVIDSLKQQPIMLGMVVMQLLVLIFVYLGVSENRKRDHAMIKFILERCLPVTPPAST